MAEPSVATTGIDSLVVYLKEHGESDSMVLAGAIKVGQEVVEEWAKILEKAGIVKISYKLGKMYVAALIAKPEHIQTIKEEIEVKRSTLESEVNAQVMMLDQISKKVDELSKIVSGGEEAFKKKSPALKKYLDDLNRLHKEALSKFKEVENADAHINLLAKNMDKKMKALQEHALNIEKIDTGAADSERVIEDMKSKITLAKADMEGLVKRLNDMVNMQRKDIELIINSMKAEMRAVSDNLERQENQLREGNRSSAEYKKEVEEIRKNLEKDSAHMINDVSRSKDEIDAYYKLAKDRIESFNREFEGINVSFGGISQFDKKLSDLQDQLSEAKADREKLANEIQAIDLKLKGIAGVTEQNVSSRKIAVDEAGKDVSDVSSKITKLGKKLGDIRNNIDNVAKGE